MATEQEMAKLLQDQQEWAIINHGWVAQYVFDPADINPSFIYSIGLARHNLPELLVVGNLSPNTLAMVLNTVAAKILQNKETLHTGVDIAVPYELQDGSDLRLALRTITDIDTVRRDYIVGSVKRWGPAVNCLQLMWADDKNILPTEAGYNTAMVQPLL